MRSVATSLLVFGIYLILGGLGFAFAPDLALGMFGLPASTEPWIRVVGALMLVLGFYYIRAARADLRAFYLWTVQARVGVFVVFVLFILLQWAPLTLALFAVIDLLGALWTFLTLRASSQAP
jgi:hypothetical protein